MPLAVVKHKDESAYKLEKFSLNKGRIYCFTDGFSECMDENKKEIGIEGVKKLILKSFLGRYSGATVLQIKKDATQPSSQSSI